MLKGIKSRPGFRDPLEDIQFLEDEIALWYAEIIQRKDWSKFINTIERSRTNFADALCEQLSGLKISKQHVLIALKQVDLEKIPPSKWTKENFMVFCRALREVSKPMIIAANKVDISPGRENYERLKEIYGDLIIPTTTLAEYWLRKFAEQKIIDYVPGAADFEILDPSQITEEEKTH